MARKKQPWFRFYVEAVADRKIRRLTPSQRWIWVAILAAARESPTPGTLLIAEGEPMKPSELADYADVRPREIRPAIESMTRLGMVSMQGGAVVVCNWGHRQYESDDVSRRVQAHRERKGNVTSHDEGTFHPDTLERSRNGRSNAPETETETETDLVLTLGGGSHLSHARDPHPPEPFCTKHPGGTETPCTACGRARTARDAYDAAAPARRRQAADAARRTRQACTHCDPDGWLIHNGEPTTRKCTHPGTANPGDPSTRETA